MNFESKFLYTKFCQLSDKLESGVNGKFKFLWQVATCKYFLQLGRGKGEGTPTSRKLVPVLGTDFISTKKLLLALTKPINNLRHLLNEAININGLKVLR